MLVHGWDGNAASMRPVAEGLAERLPTSVQTFSFDYGAASYHWASVPAIASCLADYIRAVSAANHSDGGDGKVLVVAHSMGGLATRFATDGAYVQHPVGNDVLAGLVTLDTPHQGSVWGNGVLARSMETVLGHHLASLMTPAPGTDGSICLAIHNYKTELPRGCKVPPYLDTSVPVDEVAGDITVRRSLFGVHLYDIGLQGDTVVSVGSSFGYPGSGPSHVQPAGERVVEHRADCSVSLDHLIDVIVNAGLASPSGALTSIGAAISALGTRGDNAAIDQILSGHYGRDSLLLLGAGFLASPCSHNHVLSYGPALDGAAAAVKADLARFAPQPLTVTSAPVPKVGLPNYDTSGVYPQVFGGGVDLTAINASLRDEILRDQVHYRQQERKYYGSTLDSGPYPGTYNMGFSPSLMSASTAVVSTMYPSSELFPGGNDGGGWMYLTAPVPSGKPVELVDLFSSYSAGLRAIAAYVERNVVATNECVRTEYNDTTYGGAQTSRAGFAPTVANYRSFALTRRGLDIGLGQGQVGAEACSTIRVTVPWSLAGPQLNVTGRRLLNGLR